MQAPMNSWFSCKLWLTLCYDDGSDKGCKSIRANGFHEPPKRKTFCFYMHNISCGWWLRRIHAPIYCWWSNAIMKDYSVVCGIIALDRDGFDYKRNWAQITGFPRSSVIISERNWIKFVHLMCKGIEFYLFIYSWIYFNETFFTVANKLIAI